jgi:hypothetical protein
MVNYGEAVTKPFTDFKKLTIGIILSLIPIVNFTVVTGFAMESSGLGKTKPSKKMPEWKDLWYLFVKGLAALAIKIIYMIPAILVITIGIGLAISDIANALLSTVITPEIMSQIKAGEAPREELRMVFKENWYLILPTIAKVAPVFLVGLLLALVASLLSPMAILNYMKNKRFSAAFSLGTVIRKSLTGKYILAWLAVTILSIVLGMALVFIPIVGIAIALFLMGVIGYSLYGQVYREV